MCANFILQKLSGRLEYNSKKIRKKKFEIFLFVYKQITNDGYWIQASTSMQPINDWISGIPNEINEELEVGWCSLGS